MSDIVTRDQQSGAVTVSDAPATQMMNFVAEALKDPNIDVAKLEALLRMQREIVGEGARVEFIVAMRDAQAEIEPVARTVQNTQTNSFYAKLEHVDAAIRPIYTRHGFSLSFDEEPTNEANMMMVVCEASHIGGHSKKYRLNSPPDTMGPKGTPTKTALHGRGSTVTFLRRYLTCNIFNVVLRNQDDDGNRGGMRFVTVDQVAEIEALMAETNTRMSDFCGTMDTRSLEEIEVSKFPVAMNLLRSKKAALSKRAAGGDQP